MKQFLNPQNQSLQNHLSLIRQKRGYACVYTESERPKNATRIWVSYDIKDDEAPVNCRSNLETWLSNNKAESFGNSIATFLIKGKCFNNNSKTAKWLIAELKKAGVLGDIDNDKDERSQYFETPGLSLYIMYRSRNEGDGNAANRYSGHFVLLHNKPIINEGGY